MATSAILTLNLILNVCISQPPLHLALLAGDNKCLAVLEGEAWLASCSGYVFVVHILSL